MSDLTTAAINLTDPSHHDAAELDAARSTLREAASRDMLVARGELLRRAERFDEARMPLGAYAFRQAAAQITAALIERDR